MASKGIKIIKHNETVEQPLVEDVPEREVAASVRGWISEKRRSAHTKEISFKKLFPRRLGRRVTEAKAY